MSLSEFDLLIIGGGINGAGIAHLASQHRLKVCLIEKTDFAAGTSSRSTKLMHGGIRYLENFDFALVYEALHERTRHLYIAPHLVQPMPFLIPVYEGDRRPLWMMKLGVWLYDLLAGAAKIEKHYSLTKNEIIKRAPFIKQAGLKGGVVYYDAQMDDARLCLENILRAHEFGADIRNHTEVMGFIRDDNQVVGVQVKDTLTHEVDEIRAKHVVVAAGPWADRIMRELNPEAKKHIRMTKGIHIVYDEVFCETALMLPSDKDGRIFFVIPWKGCSLIGTTDTNFIASPDTVEVDEADIRYLVDNTKRVFSEFEFHESKVVNVFAGLRPLVRKGGHPSKVSRKHEFHTSEDGVDFVMGGKYTTYRAVAEDYLRRCLRIKPRERFSLYGLALEGVDVTELSKQHGVSDETIRYLICLYGARYAEVLAYGKQDPALLDEICTCSPAIKAQIIFARQKEFARTEEDVHKRRLGLQYMKCQSKAHEKMLRELF